MQVQGVCKGQPANLGRAGTLEHHNATALIARRQIVASGIELDR